MCDTTKACLCKSTMIGSAPGTAGTYIYIPRQLCIHYQRWVCLKWHIPQKHCIQDLFRPGMGWQGNILLIDIDFGWPHWHCDHKPWTQDSYRYIAYVCVTIYMHNAYYTHIICVCKWYAFCCSTINQSVLALRGPSTHTNMYNNMAWKPALISRQNLEEICVQK